MSKQYGYGYKFLTPYGSTIYKGKDFYYNLPRGDQKWSDQTYHPAPAKEKDNNDYGPGRLHARNKLSADYAPKNWWVWFVRYELEDIIGQSNEKTGVKKLQLRKINQYTFWKIIRLGYCSNTNLAGANLDGANLRYANLQGVNLWGANLRGVNLWGADLRYANLRGVNLWGADLRYANLQGVNLWGADLGDADLWGARTNKYTLFPKGYENVNN